jgi:hypothetical protein
MALAAAMRGVPYTLISAATTGNGNVVAPPVSFNNHVIIIKGAGGVASGAVQVESADDPDYTGTWAQIGGGPTTVVDVTELMVTFTGAYPFIRARVSTVVAGGTVTCTYAGRP